MLRQLALHHKGVIYGREMNQMCSSQKMLGIKACAVVLGGCCKAVGAQCRVKAAADGLSQGCPRPGMGLVTSTAPQQSHGFYPRDKACLLFDLFLNMELL